MENQINISVTYNENSVLVTTDIDRIELHLSSPIRINQARQDFAVWIFLPIAMKMKKNIHISGMGTKETVKNAKKMSQIWASWMPSHFSDVEVTFDTIVFSIIEKDSYKDDSVCFYSGGVDSTYCIANKVISENKRLSLLTVHGMDYAYDDHSKFDYFIQKTTPFVEQYGKERIFIRTNAYSVYNKYKVNTKKHHVSHIFTLAGCGFLYSGYFKNIVIAADYRVDQQFMVYPWGSNSATNFLFNDGITKMVTENDDITRAEKLPYFLDSEVMLSSLTFCVDKKSRPHNCGICTKCTRTKLMFMAATGVIPDIFKNRDINKKSYQSLNVNSTSQQAFVINLYFSAKNNGQLNSMQELEELMNKIRNSKQSKITKFLQKIKDILDS